MVTKRLFQAKEWIEEKTGNTPYGCLILHRGKRGNVLTSTPNQPPVLCESTPPIRVFSQIDLAELSI
jgi:hypothetical protein